MRIDVWEDIRTVGVWLSHDDEGAQDSSVVTDFVRKTYSDKWTVVILRSGEADLGQSISELLSQNKMACTFGGDVLQC